MFEARSVYDIQRWLQHIFESKLLRTQEIRHYVLTVNKTDYVVKRLAIDGQTRVAMLVKRFCNLFQVACTWNRRHFCSGNHSLADDSVGKLKNPMNQASFFGTKVSAFAGDVDQLA